MATLTITATEDFTDNNPALPADITSIVYQTAGLAVATFRGNQFGPGLISNAVAITGGANSDAIRVIAASGSFSAAGWTFQNWTDLDNVTIDGAAGADQITGSLDGDRITAGTGADTVNGGGGDDFIRMESTHIVAGEVIDGGSHIAADAIELNGIGTFDLTLATISNIERLTILTNNATVLLTGPQIDAIGEIDANPLATAQALVVSGASVDLSDIVFTDWNSANHSITINGTGKLAGSIHADTINGGAGADAITGGLGGDTLNGGQNNDTFIFAVTSDAVGDVVNGGPGSDTVRTTTPNGGGFQLTTFSSIERLELFTESAAFLATQFGAGLSNALAVTGNAQANEVLVSFLGGEPAFNASGWTFAPSWDATDRVRFNGADGAADTITGSLKSDIFDGDGGADILSGLAGDDTFRFDQGEIASGLSLNGGDGSDEIRLGGAGVFDFSQATLSLIEKLALTNNGASTATLRSTQIGAGAITQIFGGPGSNALIVNAFNLINPNLNVNLSSLTFTDWTSGSDTVTLNGLAGFNTLTGTSHNDIIDGKGGGDTMNGLAGDDLYFVDSLLDSVSETPLNGADEVRTSVTYTLPNAQAIEILSTTNAAATNAIDLTGNSFLQTINGNAGKNVIDGKGGADVMNGFGDNDRYIVDNALDIVNEALIGGNDQVDASVDYALKAGQEIETLTAAGADSIDLTGNEFAQLIVGNGAANVLKGLGGADTLAGGGGDSDMADYSEKTQPVVVFLDGANNVPVTVGGAVEDTIREIEFITGGSAGDSLVGDGLLNFISGGGGADFIFTNGFNPDGTIKSNANSDFLHGDAGDDGLFGGDGGDSLNGGDGNDGLVGGANADFLFGGDGGDFLFGGAFSTIDGSFLSGSGKDGLSGGAGNDGLWGFDDDDNISGEDGDDYVEGGAGNDTIFGGAGSDFLLGQGGNDTINGGTGFDFMFGDVGADTFIFKKGDSGDWILDFSAAQGDKLRFENFGFANFAAIPLVDLSTPGNPAVQLTFIENGNVDQLTIFGATLAQLNAGNVLVA